MSAIVGGLQFAGLVYPSEQLSYNWAFQLRGERAWDERVAVVTIDDASLQKLGRYPWPRQRFTELMQVLDRAEATTVVFDVIFSEPTADDRAFGQAIAAHGNVILAQAVDFNGLPLQPVPALSQAALGIGHIYRRTDGDGLTRQIPWTFRGEPTLAAVTLQAYGTQHRIPPLPETSPDLWLNWVGPVQRLPRYSFVDVLNGQIPPQALKHKIVLVGVGATGFDTLVTPFNRNPTTTGIYLHATAINNLLNQTELRYVNANGRFSLVCCLLTPGIGIGFSYLKAKQQLALLSSGLLTGWAGAIVALSGFNTYVPIALPTGLWVGTAISVAIFERLRMHELLQTELQQLSQRYLPSRDVATTPIALNRAPAALQTANQLTAIAHHLGAVQMTQRAITQSLSVGVIAFDHQHNVCFCNATAQQWLRYEPGATLGSILVPQWLEADDWQMIQQTLHADTQDTPPAPIDREVNLQEHWYSLNFSPVQADPINIGPPEPGYILLIEDITARKQLETSLYRQVQELEWLAQLKDELLDRISHELRSPITNMLFAIDLLRTSRTRAQQQQYLDRLEQACIQERNFINDLLNLQTAPTAPEQQLWQSLDLQPWLETLIAPFIARASTRQQTIQTLIDPQLKPLSTDPDRLTRIYQELLTNACKYSPAGATIYCTASQQADYIELSVRNLGTTIAPNELPKIFEKFYRIPQSDPWQQGGTGMGLAIVLRLAEQINASIAVRSANDVTEFQITLPNQSTSPSS